MCMQCGERRGVRTTVAFTPCCPVLMLNLCQSLSLQTNVVPKISKDGQMGIDVPQIIQAGFAWRSILNNNKLSYIWCAEQSHSFFSFFLNLVLNFHSAVTQSSIYLRTYGDICICTEINTEQVYLWWWAELFQVHPSPLWHEAVYISKPIYAIALKFQVYYCSHMNCCFLCGCLHNKGVIWTAQLLNHGSLTHTL